MLLSHAESGAELLRLYMSEGAEFSITFIHSVNQSPVTEIYHIEQNQIVLAALEFESFGAGMPTYLQPQQILRHLPGGIMRIDNFERVLDSFVYLLDHSNQMTLHFEDKSIPLSTLAEAGQALRFSFRRGGLFHL